MPDVPRPQDVIAHGAHDIVTAAIQHGRMEHRHRSSARLAGAALEALANAGYAVVQLPEPQLVNPCRCHACNAKGGTEAQFMVLCTDCGFKRCPKATNHLHACTQSNDSGQVGSSYGVPCESPCCIEYRGFVEERHRDFDAIKAELDAVRASRVAAAVSGANK